MSKPTRFYHYLGYITQMTKGTISLDGEYILHALHDLDVPRTKEMSELITSEGYLVFHNEINRLKCAQVEQKHTT